MSTIEQICCKNEFVSISLNEAELHSVCLILAFNNVKKKDTREAYTDLHMDGNATYTGHLRPVFGANETGRRRETEKLECIHIR